MGKKNKVLIKKKATDLIQKVEKRFSNLRERFEPYIPVRPTRVSTPSLGSHLVSAIGWGLLTAFIFHAIWHCNLDMHRFGNSLTVEQMHHYKKICRHRAWITVWGLIISFLPALVLVRGCRLSVGHFLCFWLLLTCFIYCIWPKGSYMLQHIQTPQQASQWFSIYLCMKHLSLSGFVIGFLLSLFIAYLSYPENQRSICNVTL